MVVEWFFVVYFAEWWVDLKPSQPWRTWRAIPKRTNQRYKCGNAPPPPTPPQLHRYHHHHHLTVKTQRRPNRSALLPSPKSLQVLRTGALIACEENTTQLSGRLDPDGNHVTSKRQDTLTPDQSDQSDQ